MPLLRRLQKYHRLFKFPLILICLTALISLVITAPPDPISLAFFLLLLFLCLLFLNSLVFGPLPSFLASLTVVFLLFLRVANLFSPFNLLLFLVAILLIVFYFYTPAAKRRPAAPGKK